MHTIYLLLGSNMGKPEEQLAGAAHHIKKKIGKISRSSSIYQTAAWGKTDQPDFLNQVIIVESEQAAPVVMNNILSIEKQMGRIRTEKNAPRVIDIDILFFNKEIIHTAQLTVPHPEIQNRRFVLIPLKELSPLLQHPLLHQNISALLAACTDKLDVKKF